MDLKQIFVQLMSVNLNCISYFLIYSIWIFVTEFLFYRLLTTYPSHKESRQSQNVEYELPRLSESRGRRKGIQITHKSNSETFVLLKILPFLILCAVLFIVPFDLISNTHVIKPTDLFTISLVWCLLRYFHLLHANPDKKRWRLRHTNQLGPGLAHNYWDGFLQNLVRDNERHVGEYGRKDVAFKDRTDFTSVVDVIAKFEDENALWCYIPRNLKKLVLLVDYTCNFEKDKKKWPELYQMEQLLEIAKLEPIIPIKMSSKTQKFGINLAKVWNPKNPDEYFHIVFDTCQILRSAMGGAACRVDDPEQKRRNIDDFVLYLRKMLKRHEVTERVEIVSFNDGSMPSNVPHPSMYEVIKKHFDDDETELFQFNSYIKEKCY